jgi:hypothetical protein
VKSSTSTVGVGAAGVEDMLHLYSYSSDPDGLSGYYQHPGTLTYAATGVDSTLAVNLGGQSRSSTTTCNRVFTIKAPAAFPSGVTSVTVTAGLVADSSTGSQPITAFGFGNVGSSSRSTSVKRTYYPSVLITVTYSGYTGSVFRYQVTLEVTGK